MSIVWHVVLSAIGIGLAALTQRYWRGWGGKAHRWGAIAYFALLSIGCCWWGLAMIFSPGHGDTASAHDGLILGTFFVAGGLAMAFFGFKAWQNRRMPLARSHGQRDNMR